MDFNEKKDIMQTLLLQSIDYFDECIQNTKEKLETVTLPGDIFAYQKNLEYFEEKKEKIFDALYQLDNIQTEEELQDFYAGKRYLMLGDVELTEKLDTEMRKKEAQLMDIENVSETTRRETLPYDTGLTWDINPELYLRYRPSYQKDYSYTKKDIDQIMDPAVKEIVEGKKDKIVVDYDDFISKLNSFKKE